MSQSNYEFDEIYREKFRGVRPIIEKHFSNIEGRRLIGIVHLFIAERESSLYEDWNFNQQQDRLTRLRTHLQHASENLAKIHPVILDEVIANLTLPEKILNGTLNRKTCAEEVFELAPSRAEVDVAAEVLRGLQTFGKNVDMAIKYTQDELPFGISVGNRNIDAWRVVEAAVSLCRKYPNLINVPKKMNSSGPMHRLLKDLFEHYNINADVDAAFNGWTKHIDRKRESLDLLPID